jgi:hypothetical protein
VNHTIVSLITILFFWSRFFDSSQKIGFGGHWGFFIGTALAYVFAQVSSMARESP